MFKPTHEGARGRGLHCAGAGFRQGTAGQGLRSLRQRGRAGSGTALHSGKGTFAFSRSASPSACLQRALRQPSGLKSGTLQPALLGSARSLRQKSLCLRSACSPPSALPHCLAPSRPCPALIGLQPAPAPLRPLPLAVCLHL